MPTHYIKITLKFEEQDDGRWTAKCVELGTATFGKSLQEAVTNINEAISLHLNTLEDVGERERFFKENNIPLLEKKERSAKINAPTNPRVFVRPQFYPVRHVRVC